MLIAVGRIDLPTTCFFVDYVLGEVPAVCIHAIPNGLRKALLTGSLQDSLNNLNRKLLQLLLLSKWAQSEMWELVFLPLEGYCMRNEQDDGNGEEGA
ncbi:MAG TPA: hypothetical protein DCK95_12245 [Anaerolineaceae bacterium]|nr:hypothetical protein [Anaerolineaceae bacterium]